MRRWGLLVMLLVTVGVLALVGWRWLQASSNRQEALHLAHVGRFAEAEPRLQQALALDESDVAVVKALALGKLKDSHSDAEEYLTRWCELRPNEAQPHRLRMDLRHRLGRSERGTAERLRLLGLALADGQRVLELTPADDEVRREVVWLLLGVGQFDEAEQTCRRCLSLAPSDPWLHYLLARACHGQGKRALAESFLDTVIRAQPQFAEALLLRATLYREADRPEQAIPLLRQALDLPRSPRKDCLYQLGLALASIGQPEEASRVMAELQLLNLKDAVAHDQFPDNAAMRVQIAEASLEAGKSEEARQLLERILADTPDFPPAHRVLARYYDQKGQPDRAADHRRRAAP